jgi:hypothetical protein
MFGRFSMNALYFLHDAPAWCTSGGGAPPSIHAAVLVNQENQRRSVMLSSLSKLTPEQLAEIRSLEQKLGKTLLSFSSYDVVSEDLSPDDLALLKALEEKLGTMIVAVRGLSRKA